jgi:serine/threonine-protein kinase RsbW/stage II sporulation protein AB (anti-sigma F factor)
LSETWNAPATAEHVAPLRRAVVEFADAQSVADPPLSDLRLAVSEAITNVVVHAYRNRGPGRVTVTATVDEERDWVEITIADEGTGLRPRHDSPGMGLGLALMSRMADTFDVHEKPAGDGTEVVLGFTLGRPATLH